MKRNLVLLLSSSLLLVSCGDNSPTSTTSSIDGSNTISSSSSKATPLTPKQAFLVSRDRTIINSDGFSYKANSHLSVTELSTNITFNGNKDAKVKFAKGNELSYSKEATSSGSLYVDGTNYVSVSNKQKTKISTNEDGFVTNIDYTTVDDNYRYETDSTAKVLFEYKDKDIKDVVKISGNNYKITTSSSYSSIASLILNNVNNPLVRKVVGELPETASNYDLYYSLSDDGSYIKNYKYDFVVTVSSFKIEYSETIEFTSYSKETISPFDINGLSRTEEEITSSLNDIKSLMDKYRKSSASSYDYKLKTAVAGLTKNDINCTIKGKTFHQTKDNTFYYINRREIDTDLKNSDMYKREKLGDINFNRGKLLDKTTYDAIDGMIKNTYIERNEGEYDESIESFLYLLGNSFYSTSNFEMIQKIGSGSKSTYSLCLKDSALTTFYSYFNDSSRNLIGIENGKSYKPFGSFRELKYRNAEFLIKTENSSLSSIELNLEATTYTNFERTNIFGDGELDLDFNLDVTNDYQTTSIPEKAKDLLQLK